MAFLIGPVLGGLLLPFGWQWLFLINLPIAVLLIGFAWQLLPGTGSHESHPFDWRGAVVLTTMLVALAVAVTNLDSSAPVASLRAPAVWPFLTVIVLVMPVFWKLEQQAIDPIVRPSFFRSLQIRLTVTIALGIGMVESASVFFPALAVATLGVTEANAAWLMLPSVLAMTIAAPLVGKLLDKVGSRAIVALGLACVLVGLLIYSLTDMTVALFIAGGIITGAGLSGLLGAPLR